MDWQVVLFEPARVILATIGQFLIKTLLVVIILIIGWILAKLVKTVVTKALKTLRVDVLSERIEFEQILQKGGITYTFSELVGVVAYWIGLLVTFMVAMNAVDLPIAADLLSKVLLYIPNVVAAMFILILSMFFATLLKNIVQTAANNAGLSQGVLFGKVTEIIVVLFGIVVALEQLNIGIQVTQLTLAIILGSIGLAFGLSFGLGCKDIVSRAVNDLLDKVKRK